MHCSCCRYWGMWGNTSVSIAKHDPRPVRCTVMVERNGKNSCKINVIFICKYEAVFWNARGFVPASMSHLGGRFVTFLLLCNVAGVQHREKDSCSWIQEASPSGLLSYICRRKDHQMLIIIIIVMEIRITTLLCYTFQPTSHELVNCLLFMKIRIS